MMKKNVLEARREAVVKEMGKCQNLVLVLDKSSGLGVMVIDNGDDFCTVEKNHYISVYSAVKNRDWHDSVIVVCVRFDIHQLDVFHDFGFDDSNKVNRMF